MGKDEEIKRLTEELEAVRKAYATEIPMRLQKEDKEMYDRILMEQDQVEEAEETRPIAEVYNLWKYSKEDMMEELEVGGISFTSSESEDSEDARMGANNL